MTLDELKKYYDELQLKYGAPELDSIYSGGCDDRPDVCFVFMNPTSRNIASSKSWKGLKAPWIGTKNIWDLFYQLKLLDENVYKNQLERDIADTIRNLGKDVVAGASIAGLSADLMFDNTIVEVDGMEDEPKEKITNMRKQSILERSGYTVKRVSFREWQVSQKACLDRLLM